MCTSRSTVAHIHVRDPETGGVSHDPELYAETVRLIRADEDIVINVTSGGGGDFIPSLEHPETGGEGTWIQTPEERFKPIGDLLPEMCTLWQCQYGRCNILKPCIVVT